MTFKFLLNVCGKHNLKGKNPENVHFDPDDSKVLTDIALLLKTYDFTQKNIVAIVKSVKPSKDNKSKDVLKDEQTYKTNHTG